MDRIDEQTFALWARQAGFGRTGFCSACDFSEEMRCVEEGPDIAERKQLRFLPVSDCPEAKSLAVLLWPYAPAPLPKGDHIFVDSYYFASNAAYHAARELEAKLQAAGHFAKANVSYPAREAAIRAGMGIIGKNGLLITPEYGTRVVIILIATDIEHSAPDACNRGSCLECGRCAKACPAGALDENGMSHPERCIRNFMMEGVVAPEHLREKMGMKLIGCDICQRVCPMQKNLGEGKEIDLTLDAFMTEDSAAFSKSVHILAEEIGRNAARPQRVRAQAALLSGNRKDPKDLPVLEAWSKSPFEAVREHAIWAAHRIKSDGSGLDQNKETGYNKTN